MSQSRWATALAMVTLTLLVASGCTGSSSAAEDPTPATSTSPTASPSPAPSPTPSPTSTQEPEPTPGPDFDRVDEVGAQAAAVYFLNLFSYMNRTGDETTFAALAWDPTCAFCKNVIDNAREIHTTAAVIEGSQDSVEILKSYPFDPIGGGYALDIRVTETDGFFYNTDGELIHKEPGGSRDARIELLHDGQSWRLMNILRLEDLQ